MDIKRSSSISPRTPTDEPNGSHEEIDARRRMEAPRNVIPKIMESTPEDSLSDEWNFGYSPIEKSSIHGNEPLFGELITIPAISANAARSSAY